MTENPLVQLERLGQAIWLDSIRRGQIVSGELKRLIDDVGLSGETANPTIFEKAIAGSADYDEAIRRLVQRGSAPLEIYETIAIEDVRMAADVFRPVYDRTMGGDGFVSIEVSPKLAYDTQRTIEEAKRFFREVNRPNVMIKIPGTKEGVPAIEQCLYEGLNINITLLFSIRAYEEVAWAYIHALERRASEGKPIDRIASVASFFVSRIDTLADKQIEEMLRSDGDAARNAKLEALGGKVAIANAKLAYQSFKRIFGDSRFLALKAKGARVQRPLWASTSTKNPHYPDTLYVDSLIGSDTINTLPLETIMAYRDHGHPELTIEKDLDSARRTIETLPEVGLSLDAITDQVLVEGVQKFDDSLNQLLQVIASKRQAMAAQTDGHTPIGLGSYATLVEAALDAAEKNKMVDRIWKKDPTVWKREPEHQAEIRNRLGWLTIGRQMKSEVERLVQFGTEIKEAKFKSVVLCGMGGSSLCVEVMRQTFGSARGYPKLEVLDSTDPATILELEKRIDPVQTLFVIASKSGGTVETTDHFRYFYSRVHSTKWDRAGENFVAITDAGSALEKAAQDRHFRRIFLNASDIGGRYSALSYFGLVPAAAMGIDIEKLLDLANKMAQACGPNVPAKDNPGLWLGTVFGTLAQHGRDKITLVTSPGIDSFGMWVEQLIAESTGKEGKGLVPIDREPLGAPSVYGDDRVFVYLRLATARNAAIDRKVDTLEQAGHPVIRLNLEDKNSIGGEFFRWEFAVAVAGALMGIDAFDQPNVQESKDNTKRVLASLEREGALEFRQPTWEDSRVAVYQSQDGDGARDLSGNLAAFLGQAKPGDYLAVMSYLQETPKNIAALEQIRLAVRNALKVATTLGYGPRFLHSTGQLHKGGPNTVLALQITDEDQVDAAIPGEPYTFGTLKQAQAIGDWEALLAHQRRALRVQFKRGADLGSLMRAVERALSPGRSARKTAKRPQPAIRKSLAAKNQTSKKTAKTARRVRRRA